jgi:hypothetical protein
MYGIKISGVFASDGFVRKKTFHGFEVCDYSTAKSRFGDMIVLLCFGTPLGSVIDNIKRIATEQELYAPDVPVYGNTLFNIEYVRENAENLREVYDLLADEQSKKVFENTVLYKLSGNIQYLFDCESSPDEANKSILMLGDNETYFDLGAYRGDTVAEFLHCTKGYNKIVAVEPDIKTYSKLCSATQNIEKIININAIIVVTNAIPLLTPAIFLYLLFLNSCFSIFLIGTFIINAIAPPNKNGKTSTISLFINETIFEIFSNAS